MMMYLRQSISLGLFTLVSVFLSGCAFSSSALPILTCPDAPGPLTGAVVFGQNANLTSMHPDGSALTPLTSFPAHGVARSPLWSPDGETLAFSLTSFNAVPAANIEFQAVDQKLCGLDRRTGKGRTLFQGFQQTDRMDEFTWSADGHQMVIGLSRSGAPPLVMSIDLATGTMSELLRAAQTPALSPDGRQLAFIRLVVNQGGITSTLMLAQADGQQERSIASADPPLLYFSTPRWSPDSRTLLFTASAQRPQGRAAGSSLSWLDRLLGVAVAYAHTVPADLWLIDADGQNLQRLTSGLDDPRAEWSPDGTQLIYSNGFSGGLFRFDLATKQPTWLIDQGGESTITWNKTIDR